jgi:hypothetical protein
MSKLYNMDLHERIPIEGSRIWIIRVPGGWLYEFYRDNGNTTTFVPYDREFA